MEKVVFCEIRDSVFAEAVYRVYTDGSLDLDFPFSGVPHPENLKLWQELKEALEKYAQADVKMHKELPWFLPSCKRGYRSRLPEAFDTLCAFMQQGPPFEPDKEEEYDEDDYLLRYTVVPRIENPWEDDPDFDPCIIY